MPEFTEKDHLLKETQYDYRKSPSKNTVAINLSNDILKAMNKYKTTLAVMPNYSKAFDTVDYEILIIKLHRLNISKQVLQMMVLFLRPCLSRIHDLGNPSTYGLTISNRILEKVSK